MAKVLKTMPLAEVKPLLATLPKPAKPKLGDHAATATMGGTRGKDHDNASRLPPDEARSMKRAMGMVKNGDGVIKKGNTLYLGAPVEGSES
jgi:hypothetical protein